MLSLIEPIREFFLGFGDIGLLVWTLIKILCITVPLILGVAYFTLFERKVIGWMHVRQGPVYVGRVFGIDYSTTADLGEGNFERKEANGTERVFALDEKTGKLLWENKYPVKYTISYPQGPRCTPTVDGERVYFLGAEGNLICCDVASGKILWQVDLKAKYGTKSALWGYAAHPLVDGKKVITLAGGEVGYFL